MTATSQSYRNSRFSTLLMQVALVAALLCATSVVRAAGGKFKDVYESALEDYRAGRYKKALREFEKAYLLEADPAALFSIARCHHHLGSLAEAVDAYELFLTEAPDHKGVPKAREFLVEVLLERGRKALAAGDPAGSRVAFLRAKELHALAAPDLRDATAGIIFLRLAEMWTAAEMHSAAVVALESALRAALSDADRTRAETLLRAAKARVPPAILPAGGGDEVADRTPVPPATSPVLTGSDEVEPPVSSAKPSAVPPPEEGKRRAWLVPALGVGGALAGVVIAGIVVGVVMARPGTDAGYWPVSITGGD